MRVLTRGHLAGQGELRVLHVVTSTTFSGIERHVVHLTRRLVELGCDARIACPPNADRLRAEASAKSIKVHPASRCRQGSWLAALARSVSQSPPHVLHVHDGRAAVLGSFLAPLVDAGFVRTQHFLRPASLERSGWAGRASLTLHRSLNRRLEGYVAISQSVADAALQRRETGDARLAVIPPALELPSEDRVSAARIARAAAKRPLVAFAGRLEPERRLDVLIRAVPIVLERIPECRFLLAGEGAAEADLRQLTTRLNVDEAVNWAGWVADPYSVMARAHVYVNTWQREGFGMAMVEAMALALPVIAVNSGAGEELIDNGVTGWLVDHGDPVALAERIVHLLADREHASQMGDAAQRRALALYGAERTAQASLDLYCRLLARPAG